MVIPIYQLNGFMMKKVKVLIFREVMKTSKERDIFKQTKECSKWILLILFENFTTNLYQNRKG
jgi:hypothetical protein